MASSLFGIGIALLLSVTGSTSGGGGDAPELHLEVDPAKVGVEDSLVVTLRLSGMASGLGEPRLELGKDFRLVGTAKSHNISFINGRTSVEVRYQFTVQPMQQGIFDLGPAEVTWGREVIRSDTARVQVVGGSVAPAPRRVPNPWAPFMGEERRPRGDVRAKVRMVAALDKEEAFVGEPVTYTIRLLTQQSVQSVKPRSEPQLTGLWVEPVDVPSPPQPQKTTYDGEPFTAFLLKKAILYPTSSGTIALEPSFWDITVNVSDFFFGEAAEVTRQTEPLSLKVQPLPEAGKPAGFAGAVGELSLSATLDKSEAEVNDALALKVTLSGTGNLKAAPAPELPALTDFRLYSPNAPPATPGKKGGASGARTWEYVLVATAPGPHVIPAITYPYFDPGRREYRVLKTEPFSVTVRKGAGEPEAALGRSGPEPAGSRKSVEPVRKDVAYLKLAAPGLGTARTPLYRSRAFQAALFLPIVTNLAAALYQWGRRRQVHDASWRRRRSALREAKRKLKSADPRHPDTFAARVSEAVLGYLGDRFDVPAHGLTHERIAELLGGAGDRAHASDMKRLLDRLDFLRFTPAAADPKEMRKLEREALARLAALDRKLGRARPSPREAGEVRA